MTTPTLQPDSIPSLDLTKLGPCGSPCDTPCDEANGHSHDESGKHTAEPDSFAFRSLKTGLFNALDICFDDVYQEPKRILMLGGCRQIPFAQHIALLLPAAEITLIDSCEDVVERTRAEICCRFKFVTSPLESLPYDDGHFDLTIAHQFLAYPQDWKKAISEMARVTSKNVMISEQRPLMWNLAKILPGFRDALKCLGGDRLPAEKLETPTWMTHLLLHTKLKTRLMPFPWAVYMTEIRPSFEEKLVLS